MEASIKLKTDVIVSLNKEYMCILVSGYFRCAVNTVSVLKHVTGMGDVNMSETNYVINITNVNSGVSYDCLLFKSSIDCKHYLRVLGYNCPDKLVNEHIFNAAIPRELSFNSENKIRKILRKLDGKYVGSNTMDILKKMYDLNLEVLSTTFGFERAMYLKQLTAIKDMYNYDELKVGYCTISSGITGERFAGNPVGIGYAVSDVADLAYVHIN